MNLRIAATIVAFSLAIPLHADELATRIEALTKKYEATVGVAAIDTVTGREVNIHAADRFPMGSVYKLPIVMSVLRKVSLGKLSLDGDYTIEPENFSPGHSPLAEEANGRVVTLPLGALVLDALKNSDNTASDALLGIVGGTDGVNGYLKFLGVLDMDVSRSEKEIAADIKKSGEAAYWSDRRDSSSPKAMVLLLRMFDERAHGLNTGSQQFVHDLLLHSTNGEKRIRAGVDPQAVVLEKTGTMPGVVNDAAIVTSPDDRHRIVLVVFSKGWKKTPEPAREGLIADIARAVYADFTRF